MKNLNDTDEFFENNSFNKRIIMGDKNNPKNSINLSKSWNDSTILEQEFQNQENALINVPCTSTPVDMVSSLVTLSYAR